LKLQNAEFEFYKKDIARFKKIHSPSLPLVAAGKMTSITASLLPTRSSNHGRLANLPCSAFGLQEQHYSGITN
jgi:hypothetical protein